MSRQQVIALPIYRAVREQHDITHVVCCNEDYGLCGEDVSEDHWVPDTTPVSCPLCAIAPSCFICRRPQ